MGFRLWFNNRRLQVVKYCILRGKNIKSQYLLDLHNGDTSLEQWASKNKKHLTFIDPIFNPFFDVLKNFDQYSDCTREFVVLKMCLERAFWEIFKRSSRSAESIYLPSANEANATEFNSAIQTKFASVCLFSCNLELVLFNICALFFQKCFFALVSKQIEEDIPANRCSSLTYWLRSVDRICVTLIRHFAYTWFQKKGENAAISQLDIQDKVLDTIDFLWNICSPVFDGTGSVEDAMDAVCGYLVNRQAKYHGRINFNEEYFRHQRRKCDSGKDLRYVIYVYKFILSCISNFFSLFRDSNFIFCLSFSLIFLDVSVLTNRFLFLFT